MHPQSDYECSPVRIINSSLAKYSSGVTLTRTIYTSGKPNSLLTNGRYIYYRTLCGGQPHFVLLFIFRQSFDPTSLLKFKSKWPILASCLKKHLFNSSKFWFQWTCIALYIGLKSRGFGPEGQHFSLRHSLFALTVLLDRLQQFIRIVIQNTVLHYSQSGV